MEEILADMEGIPLEEYLGKYTERWTKKEVIKARDFVYGIAKDLEKINAKIKELIKRKAKPNFDVYEYCMEAE